MKILFIMLGLFCLTVGIFDVYWALTNLNGHATFYGVFATINIIGGCFWLLNAATVD